MNRQIRFPLTDNDGATTTRVADAFAGYFSDRAGRLPRQSAGEDFSDIPTGLGVPTPTGASAGSTRTPTAPPSGPARVDQDIPGNHSAAFAPVIQPTLDTGTQALITAALAWL